MSLLLEAQGCCSCLTILCLGTVIDHTCSDRSYLQGPILRTIQRFGKLGRRSGKGNENTMKDTKYMFISIDEAGSHIRVKHFR